LAFKIGGTTVIDNSRNLYPSSRRDLNFTLLNRSLFQPVYRTWVKATSYPIADAVSGVYIAQVQIYSGNSYYYGSTGIWADNGGLFNTLAQFTYHGRNSADWGYLAGFGAWGDVFLWRRRTRNYSGNDDGIDIYWETRSSQAQNAVGVGDGYVEVYRLVDGTS